MTLTVSPRADPWWALASRPDSSGAMREAASPALVLFQRWPNAIPVVSNSTMLKRLPQAALRFSPRPVHRFDLLARNIYSPFLLCANEHNRRTQLLRCTVAANPGAVSG